MTPAPCCAGPDPFSRMVVLVNLETKDERTCLLERAAAIAQLNPEEGAWALEEHGQCETDTHLILEPPEPWPVCAE